MVEVMGPDGPDLFICMMYYVSWAEQLCLADVRRYARDVQNQVDARKKGKKDKLRKRTQRTGQVRKALPRQRVPCWRLEP